MPTFYGFRDMGTGGDLAREKGVHYTEQAFTLKPLETALNMS